MASIEESVYFCHICSSLRSDSQVTPTSTGDICCLVCNNEGFVEKGVFQNALGPGRQGSSVTIRSNVDGGSNSVASSNLDDGRAAAAPEGEGSAGRPEQSIPDIPIELFRSILQNPFDIHAMNQILYYVMENNSNRQGPPPAAKRILETLDTDTLDEEQAKKLETCAICTEDFVAGDKIHWLSKDRTLCGHGFHVDCIVPWLKQHNSCPVCRYELPTDDANYNRQREDLRSRLLEEVQRHVDSTSQPNSGRQSSADESAPDDSAPQGRRSRYAGGRLIHDHNCRVQ
ncbi:hypothetical protein, conserved [Babesia bigemina]|uniref:RING-type E3 ubiquitin transferase n=1 Tax=Babesia bigemina TaxID=5866 RepID=A0A061DAD4_BABBI|nr:hypothetical protein, conserved [Babesia bigemina]CDR97666.1 hypothetical protein, conserved [Babesia bigemina]|eukprot:XP_012769852.1 hypothetical protein, conserved [Babesia bigemina]